MTLKSLFKAAVAELRKHQIPFAVSGGFAADLYRHEPRLTMDVDLSIATTSKPAETGKNIIQSLGLSAGISREADLAGGPLFAIRRKSTPPCIVVGRPDGQPDQAGVDILLPAIPWVNEAVERAQHNQVDFGFGPVPALTLEDVIIAKLYALNAAQPRAKDLDDLQSIGTSSHTFDAAYLTRRIHDLNIRIPATAKPFIPSGLLSIVKAATRKR